MENLNEIETTEEMDRDNLAVVATIERIEEIPYKDRIELVFLKDCGFTFICEKGHKIDDLVVYIKYDTIVPNNELFSFMSESKFRVKQKAFTEKDEYDNVIKKIYSQGIILPIQKVIAYLKNEIGYIHCDEIIESYDLTEPLKISKYIPQVKGSGSNLGNMQSKGDFPTHLVSKTDEPNISSKKRALEELQGLPIYITKKIEGSSITFGHDESDEFFVCSRNNMLKENDNKFWQAINKNNIKNKLSSISWLICSGELYGIGIHKNHLNIPDVDLMIFTMTDKRDRRRLSWDEMVDISKIYNLPLVPLVYESESFDWDFDKLQEFTDIQKYDSGYECEGVVVRPKSNNVFSKVLRDVLSVKCINREYRL